MPYDTMNPVPSTDPRDLYDNAGITDKYVSGQEPFVPDRLGLQRRTWKGMEVDFNNAQEGRQNTFDQFLNESALIWIGDYGTGLTFTSRSQYMVRDGMAYRLATSTTIPYTTTGNWAIEQTKFSLVNSDQILRQDLASMADANKAAALVSRGAEAVDSIVDLLTRVTTGGRHISVASYHQGWASTTAGALGHGVWAWDATEPKANHNGFDKISPTVPWDGSFAALNAFQVGTGETAPGTTGCWIRIHGANDIVSWGCLPAPGVNNFSPLSHAVAWAYASKRKLLGNSGTFEYGETLDLSYPTLVFHGNGFRNTVFKFTGTGQAMRADGDRPNNGIFSFDIDLADFTIEGNASTTNLLRVRINHARLVRINLREASTTIGCGLRIEGVVAGHFEQITMSTNTQLMTSRPQNGIVIHHDTTMSNQRATCNTIISPCIEGASGDGIVFFASDQATIMGGTSENNGGNGLTEFAGCQINTYIGFDCEHNLGYSDMFVGGQGSTFINCGSTRYFYIDNSARLIKVDGGWFDKVEASGGCVGVQLERLKVRFFGGAAGLVTNNNPFLSVKLVLDVQTNTFVAYNKPATGVALTASPMTYVNTNLTDETIVIVGGTVTQLAFRRLGVPYLMNPATGAVQLQPGDAVVLNYTGTPTITRIPGGSNNQ